MAIPISVLKRLERKEESAQRRLDALEEAVRKTQEEIAIIQKAKSAVSQGQKVNLRDILGEVRLSQKDYVLEAVKKKPKKGVTRAEVVEYLNSKKGFDISPSTVTTHLYSLRVAGLIEFDGEVWRPVL